MRHLLVSKLKSFSQDWLRFVLVPYNFLNLTVSFLFLEAAYVTTQIAGMLATKNASNEVTDIIISNFDRVDTSLIHGNLSFFMYDLRFPLFLIFDGYSLENSP